MVSICSPQPDYETHDEGGEARHQGRNHAPDQEVAQPLAPKP
jgi:hypothetical protein